MGDAAEPDLPAAAVPLVTASLVLFSLPDPAALRRWLELLTPGGRIGITTFGEHDAVWRAVDDLFDPYLPAAMLDPRSAGRSHWPTSAKWTGNGSSTDSVTFPAVLSSGRCGSTCPRTNAGSARGRRSLAGHCPDRLR